jgi:hypothetical protein
LSNDDHSSDPAQEFHQPYYKLGRVRERIIVATTDESLIAAKAGRLGWVIGEDEFMERGEGFAVKCEVLNLDLCAGGV